MCAKSFSHVQLFATHRAPLSMEFSRQEYWSGLPCSPGDFPKTGTDTGLLWLLHFSWIFHCWATGVVLSTVYSLPKGSWREMNECSVLRKIVRNISSQFTFSKRPWSLLPLVQFSSVTQSCPSLCDPMNCRTPGLPVHHQLPEFTQTHAIDGVSDAIQPSHPLS